MLSNYRVLLIGNQMTQGSVHLSNLGYTNIAGVIPCGGLKDVPNVLDQASHYSFDAALVSAGVSANMICAELAKQNKTAIDFGQMIDRLLLSNAVLKKET